MPLTQLLNRAAVVQQQPLKIHKRMRMALFQKHFIYGNGNLNFIIISPFHEMILKIFFQPYKNAKEQM